MNQTIIEPKKGWVSINFRELYKYRELLGTLAYRDFRIKYAQTTIGVLWAIINPLFTLLILTFVFGTVAKVATPTHVPHIIFTIVGMAGWSYFATVLSEAGGSIIGAQEMVKKIYFPRLIIPLSKAITAFVDFAVVFVFMILLMVFYQVPVSSNIVWFPFFFLMTVIAGLTGGIWMSALTIRFRDFLHITPFIIRIGMYATPIAYPVSAAGDYKYILFINPMCGVVEGLRWSVLGGNAPDPLMFISLGIFVVLFVFGLFYFRKVERVIADIL